MAKPQNYSLLLNKIHPSLVFLVLSIILATAIRIGFILSSPYPINDGGLFYTMTEELLANNFQLPDFSNYNHLQIPYAYPPLGLYLAGFLSRFIGLELFPIFRFLPVTFSLLAIPAFYFLIKTMRFDDLRVGLAVLIFSLLPTTFEWLVMGGGITRAPGFFFSLLAIRSIYRLFTRGNKLDIILTALFSSLTILFHPESAIHTVAAALVFFFILGRTKKALIKSIIVVAEILILTSPWWLMVVTIHGLNPFINAGSTGFFELGIFLSLLMFDFTSEFGLTSIGVLGLIGFFFSISKKQLLLPVWLILTFFIEPRSGPLYISPVIAVLAAIAILFIGEKIDNSCLKIVSAPDTPFATSVSKILLALLLVHWSISSALTMNQLITTQTLRQSDFDVMAWVKDNTEAKSRFLILTGLRSFRDPLNEWFPALSQRVSITAVQGKEWQNKVNFSNVIELNNGYQMCAIGELNCFSNGINVFQPDFDYLIVRKSNLLLYDNRIIVTNGLNSNSILWIENYSPIYQDNEVSIFQK